MISTCTVCCFKLLYFESFKRQVLNITDYFYVEFVHLLISNTRLVFDLCNYFCFLFSVCVIHVLFASFSLQWATTACRLHSIEAMRYVFCECNLASPDSPLSHALEMASVLVDRKSMND